MPALRPSRLWTIAISKLDARTAVDPDVSVIRALLPHGPDVTHYLPQVTVLVVEVVPPDSIDRDRDTNDRDRDTKPHKYARAGIEHIWRVETNEDEPVIFTYRLDPTTRCYVATGIHHDRLETSEPFPVEFDFSKPADYFG